jgi:hypothetical protein
VAKNVHVLVAQLKRTIAMVCVLLHARGMVAIGSVIYMACLIDEDGSDDESITRTILVRGVIGDRLLRIVAWANDQKDWW